MRLHILGICGTFMGGVAAIARELGLDVEGSDTNVYPPMSTQLEGLGILLKQGYTAEHLHPVPDLVVVGNAMTRGNPAIESMLDERMPYISGPQCWAKPYWPSAKFWQWLARMARPRRRACWRTCLNRRAWHRVS